MRFSSRLLYCSMITSIWVVQKIFRKLFVPYKYIKQRYQRPTGVIETVNKYIYEFAPKQRKQNDPNDQETKCSAALVFKSHSL